MSEEHIKVCVRFKGPAEAEFSSDSTSVTYNNTPYTFDYVLNPHSQQAEVYKRTSKAAIDDFMRGYNATLLAYGQSGSGKTYTMLGPEEVVESIKEHGFHKTSKEVKQLFGVIPRSILDIHLQMDQLSFTQGSHFEVRVHYFEIYNESLNNLLTYPPVRNLKVNASFKL